MTFKQYQTGHPMGLEQERILRHKIGDELFDLLDECLESALPAKRAYFEIMRGQYGMDEATKGTSKIQLSRLQIDRLLSRVRAKNEKQSTRNDITPYSY